MPGPLLVLVQRLEMAAVIAVDSAAELGVVAAAAVLRVAAVVVIDTGASVAVAQVRCEKAVVAEAENVDLLEAWMAAAAGVASESEKARGAEAVEGVAPVPGGRRAAVVKFET